jgi:hypothetical protein
MHFGPRGTVLFFLCFFTASHCFLAKNINKTFELLKYKIYQKARNRRKEQSNFSIVLRVKLILKIRVNLINVNLCYR